VQFYAGRFSLLPAKQSIFYELGSEQKFDTILHLLYQGAEFVSRGMSIIIEPLIGEDGNWMGGKIGKKAERILPIKRDGHMVKSPETLYPHVLFTLIPEEQLILIQRDRAVFSSDLLVFALFEAFFEEKLLDKGLEVAILPLTTRGKFWSDVENAEKLYGVKFHLEMPNFLGDSEKGLKEALENIKGRTNSNILDIGVSNKNGDLSITKDESTQAMVNWAEKGAGKWELTLKFPNWIKPKRIKSSDKMTTLSCCEETTAPVEPKTVIKEIKDHGELSALFIKKPTRSK